MPFATVKAIVPKQMNIKRVEQAIFKALRDEGQEDAALFEKTTATWQHEKPTFKPKIGYQGDDAYVRTEPSGNRKGVNKYQWLNKGTRVRWALMSGNWKSKTRPGYLASYRGRGRVLVTGRRLKKPRPGIKARGWDEAIYRRRAPKFRQNIKAVHNQAAGRLYG